MDGAAGHLHRWLFGVAVVGLVEVVVIAWVLRQLLPLQEHAAPLSAVPLRRWWVQILTVVTRLLVAVVVVGARASRRDRDTGPR